MTLEQEIALINTIKRRVVRARAICWANNLADKFYCVGNKTGKTRKNARKCAGKHSIQLLLDRIKATKTACELCGRSDALHGHHIKPRSKYPVLFDMCCPLIDTGERGHKQWI
jgi:5-methylcytosine-specific restriction endonuclease McrA